MENKPAENQTPASKTSIPVNDEKGEYLKGVTIIELRIAQIFVSALIVGIFTLVVGAIWAIGDIFSQDKFGAFKLLSPYTKIFIVGIILLGLFMLAIFLTVLYRRGKVAILKSMFVDMPERKDVEEYIPAKIIVAGSLISLFAIFLGLIIALIEFLIVDANTIDFWSFMAEISGGTRILLIGGLIIAFTALILAFVWLWQNGYYFLISRILRRNQQISTPHVFDKNQKIIGNVFFAVIVGAIAVLFFGIIWSIMDAIMPTGKWQVFKTYPAGIIITIIALFATVLFILLIGAMMLFKWGNIMILTALFIKVPIPNNKKDNSMVKIIALGILISIFLIATALIVWLISLSLNLFTGTNVTNIFEAMAQLSGGLTMLSVGNLILVFTLLALAFVYIFNNGYALLIQKIEQAQQKIDKSLDTVTIKKSPPKSKDTAKSTAPTKSSTTSEPKKDTKSASSTTKPAK